MEFYSVRRKLFNAFRRHLKKPCWQIAVCSLVLIGTISFWGCKSGTAGLQKPGDFRLVTDDLGRSVRIPEDITRAVSLAPNLTEIVFAIGAGDRLVGRTSFDNYPPEAEKIPTVGDTINPNIESIIAARPQVVLVSTASQIETFAKTLEAQGIVVFVTSPDSLNDIYRSIQAIGEIFGRRDQADGFVEGLKSRVANVEEKAKSVSKVKVFVQIDKNSLYTVGKASFITDLIDKAGGVSVTRDIEIAYPNISKETALAFDPEAIILTDSADNDQPNDVFRNSRAVRTGRVYKINADILSRPGPRVVDALEQIAAGLRAGSN